MYADAHTATPPHSRTNSFNGPSAFAVLNGGQAPPALQVPPTVPDLMTFDSPLPKAPLPDLPEHGSSSPERAEQLVPPPFERAAEGKDASRPQTPAASSRPQTGRVASPSSPKQGKRQVVAVLLWCCK